MSELSEQERYALFANIPYQLHEGVPISLIEEELREHGLDHEIDEQLTGDISAIIHNKNEVIHSVRGTDPTTRTDRMADYGIMLSHPYTVKTVGTIGAMLGMGFRPEPTKRPFGQPDIVAPQIFDIGDYDLTSKFLEDMKQQMILSRSQLTSPGRMSHVEFEEELKKLNKDIEKLKSHENFDFYKKGGMTVAGLSMIGTALGTLKNLPHYLRIDPEQKKLDLVKQKYPKHDISLTGHSLGSVVNILGRNNNIKSITFNPAPQEDFDVKDTPKHHPQSKIYRTKYDPVSAFLTAQDTEPVTTIAKKLPTSYNPRSLINAHHSLKNFLPEKPIRPLITRATRSHVDQDFIFPSVGYDYCKYNPESYLCRTQTRREKQFF